MSQASTGTDPRGHAKVHKLRHFRELMAEFEYYRLDPDLTSMKESERALAFIRGLRLSARLIYLIRQIISGSGLEAHWGHILSEDGRVCSRECDVIIHQPGELDRWNGEEHPVMDFRFIEHDLAIAVVSCKSKFHAVRAEDKLYCQDMRAYVGKVYLFAECCHLGKAASLRNSAEEAGYEGFWHLYAIDKEMGETVADEKEWMGFVNEIEAIATAARGGTSA